MLEAKRYTWIIRLNTGCPFFFNLKKYFYRTKGQWKYYTYDLKKAEKIHNKSKRDYDYLFELADAKTSNAYFVDKDGNVEAFETKNPHIPLIAEDYWQ